jgi:hypothetical protein
MKGIYLIEESKQELEAKIAEILIELKSSEEMDDYTIGSTYSALGVYRKILSSAIILPVEESWDEVYEKTFSQAFVEKDYPNGVIIQPI